SQDIEHSGLTSAAGTYHHSELPFLDLKVDPGRRHDLHFPHLVDLLHILQRYKSAHILPPSLSSVLVFFHYITYNDRRKLKNRSVINMDNVMFQRAADDSDLAAIAGLADAIWHQHFQTILSPEQIDYMVEKFQSYPALKSQVEEDGYEYYQTLV